MVEAAAYEFADTAKFLEAGEHTARRVSAFSPLSAFCRLAFVAACHQLCWVVCSASGLACLCRIGNHIGREPCLLLTGR